MNELQPILEAIETRAGWYPILGAVVTVVVMALKRVSPDLWAKLPQKWQWTPAVLIALCGGFADSYAADSVWWVALLMAVYAAATAGMAAVGIHHTAKRVASVQSGDAP